MGTVDTQGKLSEDIKSDTRVRSKPFRQQFNG